MAVNPSAPEQAAAASNISENGSGPRHVAIIMDGNNRWAKKRLLPAPAGHRAGVEAIRGVLRGCADHDVQVLTLFAFSSENWNRPRAEVSALMDLFLTYLRRETKALHKDGVRIRIIGARDRFSAKLLREIENAEALTRDNSDRELVIAADYGGQWDIIESTRRLALKVAAGELAAEAIDSKVFEAETSIGDLPCPDLLIRTGGDHRISNFLLWHSAYTEFYFTEVLWPDFDEKELDLAINDFKSRQRRFGGRDEAE